MTSHKKVGKSESNEIFRFLCTALVRLVKKYEREAMPRVSSVLISTSSFLHRDIIFLN